MDFLVVCSETQAQREAWDAEEEDDGNKKNIKILFWSL